MEYQKYLRQKKKLHESVIQLIKKEDIDNNDYDQVYFVLENKKNLEDREEIILFIRLLVQISNNHHRTPNFFKKIQKLLEFLIPYIKQTFTNFEIFNLFKSNKLLIIYLIEHKIITIDETIAKEIINRSDEKKNSKYQFFFYPEIKNYLENEEQKNIIEHEIRNIGEDKFENNRKIGENENYICELIRNDSIESFVIYVNQTNLSLFNTTIKPSIFETNSFLIKNEPSLIEYAAFFGSIQIFQYLKLNNVEMNPSLWLYAIHGGNAEIIHILEENSIKPPNNRYVNCFNESVKCHHNEITNYFEEVYLVNQDKIDYKYIFQSYNFQCIPSKFDKDSIFYYLFYYDYSKLVDLYIQPKINQYKLTNKISILMHFKSNS